MLAANFSRCTDELWARKPGFDSRQRQESSLLQSSEIGPGGPSSLLADGYGG
jgi:hypothetical protein